jgi:hypothetical protein
MSYRQMAIKQKRVDNDRTALRPESQKAIFEIPKPRHDSCGGESVPMDIQPSNPPASTICTIEDIVKNPSRYRNRKVRFLGWYGPGGRN